MERYKPDKTCSVMIRAGKGDDFLYNGKIDASVGLIEADDQVIQRSYPER